MCLQTWSKDPRPSIEQMMTWLWEEGKYVIEGDSNVHNTNAKRFVHPLSFNIGMGGDIPMASSPAMNEGRSGMEIVGVVNQFPQLVERHRLSPVERAYIQIGGNLWTWHPYNPYTKNLDLLNNGIREIIKAYKTILDPNHIVIASLPFINPSLTVGKMPGDDYLPKKVRKDNEKINLNELFKAGNVLILKACLEEGVQYLDIFLILEELWRRRGKSAWWDEVHYALEGQALVGAAVRKLWGV